MLVICDGINPTGQHVLNASLSWMLLGQADIPCEYPNLRIPANVITHFGGS